MAGNRDPAETLGAAIRWLAGTSARRLTRTLGGVERTRVIVLLAAVLALSSADATTVGAAARPLRDALRISNTDIGLLVTVTSLVAALASLPFGVLADRVRRTWTLGATIVLWGGAMIWSATVSSFEQLLVSRLVLGGVTAAAGPIVASLVGDYFASEERGRIYGFILAGELAVRPSASPSPETLRRCPGALRSSCSRSRRSRWPGWSSAFPSRRAAPVSRSSR